MSINFKNLYNLCRLYNAEEFVFDEKKLKEAQERISKTKKSEKCCFNINFTKDENSSIHSAVKDLRSKYNIYD